MRSLTPHSLYFYLKYGVVLLLILLCALVAACNSSGTDSQTNSSNPLANGTIDLNGTNSSPTPPLSPYLCGAWVTNTSPSFSPDRPISVFAKFVQTNTPQDPGNPVGVDGATATATLHWPDGTTENITAKTTSDGLAVFPILVKPDSANKLVLIQVTFSKVGVDPCTVSQPAYFIPRLVSPTPTPPPADTTPIDTTPTVEPTVILFP